MKSVVDARKEDYAHPVYHQGGNCLQNFGEESFNDFLPEGGAHKALNFRRSVKKWGGGRRENRSQMEGRENKDGETAQRLCG